MLGTFSGNCISGPVVALILVNQGCPKDGGSYLVSRSVDFVLYNLASIDLTGLARLNPHSNTTEMISIVTRKAAKFSI